MKVCSDKWMSKVRTESEREKYKRLRDWVCRVKRVRSFTERVISTRRNRGGMSLGCSHVLWDFIDVILFLRLNITEQIRLKKQNMSE